MSIFCWPKGYRPPIRSVSSRRCCPPIVEELESRLTPAEVGRNDFRLSFMGPDGNPNFGAFNPAVAYNGASDEYLVVWTGDDTTDGDFEVYGQRVSAATGALLGGAIQLSDTAFGASN